MELTPREISLTAKLSEIELRIRRLEEALTKIRDGLADTGSTPGQRMTLITKADAYEIARRALES